MDAPCTMLHFSVARHVAALFDGISFTCGSSRNLYAQGGLVDENELAVRAVEL